MADLICIIIAALCGLLFIYAGYLIWIKERINLIHDYHYTKVKETDKKAYTGIMGKAMIIMGIGMVISGIISIAINPIGGTICLCVCFAIGLILMTYAQIKYNHGIF